MNGAIQSTIIKELEVYRKPYLAAFLGLLMIPVLTVCSQPGGHEFQTFQGAIVRGDTSVRALALVFTGDSFADGGTHIAQVLAAEEIKASFFLTGKFYRDSGFAAVIRTLHGDGHYLGAHSDRHLLYCDWNRRDSLLVSRQQFREDLLENYQAMRRFGITMEDAPFFLPPFEWYNDTVSGWTSDLGLQLINYSPGTLSHADYTVPGDPGYRSSLEIYRSILDYETSASSFGGLNGFILLSHIGTAPERTDKFYRYLEKLIEELKSRGYRFLRIDELLGRT
jgi:peptidoglycan/xylan/chitin deacetylase (PgdA/CDA1 family)